MLIALIEEQLVIYPETNNDFSTSLIEDTVTLDHIMVEKTLEHLPVSQFYVSFTMLGVVFEMALVVEPQISSFSQCP
jgi:hypothetical protein